MDYTYVPVNNGHNYVMFIMDGYNKEVINTKVVSSRKDSVTKATISKAICSRNISKGTNLIIHSDQGVEFNNTQVKRYLKNKKIKQSFSKAGTPLDNALMESLISGFKREYNISNKKISSTKELIKLVNS
jgi:transposase InsO family protein